MNLSGTGLLRTTDRQHNVLHEIRAESVHLRLEESRVPDGLSAPLRLHPPGAECHSGAAFQRGHHRPVVAVSRTSESAQRRPVARRGDLHEPGRSRRPDWRRFLLNERMNEWSVFECRWERFDAVVMSLTRTRWVLGHRRYAELYRNVIRERWEHNSDREGMKKKNSYKLG